MCDASHTFPTYQKHLHIVPHGKLVVLPGAAGLPGCCRGVAGCCRGAAGLPGTWTHVLTAGLGSQAAGLPGCRVLPGTAGYCRVLPGCRVVAGSLPGRCRVRLPGCRGQGSMRAPSRARAHGHTQHKTVLKNRTSITILQGRRGKVLRTSRVTTFYLGSRPGRSHWNSIFKYY